MAYLSETGLARFWNHILSKLSGKVDKEEGKGLSSNDFTTEEKEKLEGIEEGANKIVVDRFLRSDSTNPVQNKELYSAIYNPKSELKLVDTYGDLFYLSIQDNTLVSEKIPYEINFGTLSLDSVKVGEWIQKQDFNKTYGLFRKDGSVDISDQVKTDIFFDVDGTTAHTNSHFPIQVINCDRLEILQDYRNSTNQKWQYFYNIEEEATFPQKGIFGSGDLYFSPEYDDQVKFPISYICPYLDLINKLPKVIKIHISNETDSVDYLLTDYEDNKNWITDYDYHEHDSRIYQRTEAEENYKPLVYCHLNRFPFASNETYQVQLSIGFFASGEVQISPNGEDVFDGYKYIADLSSLSLLKENLPYGIVFNIHSSKDSIDYLVGDVLYYNNDLDSWKGDGSEELYIEDNKLYLSIEAYEENLLDGTYYIEIHEVLPEEISEEE